MDEASGREFLRSATARFLELREAGEKAIGRLEDHDLVFAPDPESNSVAILIQHLAGNMLSRWTDFLTTDGEKPDRNRDGEFELAADAGRRERLLGLWRRGWDCLFAALAGMGPADLMRQVTIRGQRLSVMDAIHRQLAHYGQHVGQIVYLAKHRQWRTWESLTIPRRRS